MKPKSGRKLTQKADSKEYNIKKNSYVADGTPSIIII